MLHRWLSSQLRDPAAAKFATWDISEIEGTGAQGVDVLVPAVSEHLMSAELLADATKLLPPSKLRAFIEARKPSSTTLRRGVFGEVLAVRYLEDVNGMTVPIKKLHYRTASHDSPKATDVLAIRVNDEVGITEVAYVEAKLRTTRSDISKLALQAHNQLQKDCKEEIPGIMGFAAQILKDRNDPIFELIMNYLRSRENDNIDTHHVFLVVDKDCWRESDLSTLIDHEDILEPLDVYIVVIDDLPNKADRVYKLIGYEAKFDDD